MTADTIVDLFFAGIFVIFTPIVFAAGWAYLKTGTPDPRRLAVRVSLAVAALVDNATWPARGGAR